jgi:hypothetical protein
LNISELSRVAFFCSCSVEISAPGYIEKPNSNVGQNHSFLSAASDGWNLLPKIGIPSSKTLAQGRHPIRRPSLFAELNQNCGTGA